MLKSLKIAAALAATSFLVACGPSPDEMKQMYYQGENNGQAVYQFPVSVAMAIWIKTDGPVVQRQSDMQIARHARALCSQGYEVTNRTPQVRGATSWHDGIRTQHADTSTSVVTIECTA